MNINISIYQKLRKSGIIEKIFGEGTYARTKSPSFISMCDNYKSNLKNKKIRSTNFLGFLKYCYPNELIENFIEFFFLDSNKKFIRGEFYRSHFVLKTVFLMNENYYIKNYIEETISKAHIINLLDINKKVLKIENLSDFDKSHILFDIFRDIIISISLQSKCRHNHTLVDLKKSINDIFLQLRKDKNDKIKIVVANTMCRYGNYDEENKYSSARTIYQFNNLDEFLDCMLKGSICGGVEYISYKGIEVYCFILFQIVETLIINSFDFPKQKEKFIEIAKQYILDNLQFLYYEKKLSNNYDEIIFRKIWNFGIRI